MSAKMGRPDTGKTARKLAAIEARRKVREARDAAIVDQLRTTTRTLADLGDEYQMTRERIRQIGVRAGLDMADRKVRVAAARHAAYVEADLVARLDQRLTLDEAWAWVESSPVCELCGDLMPPGRKVTCSPRCAKAYPKLRYHLNHQFREDHQRMCAQTVVNHPERYKPTALPWAERVLAGENEPNRHWVTPQMKALAAEFGIAL